MFFFLFQHVNEMSYKINLEETLKKAEAIYLQIRDSKYRSDVVETILGLEHITPQVVTPVIDSQPTAMERKQEVAKYVSNKSAHDKDSTETIEEYVDLEQHCSNLFDMPY